MSLFLQPVAISLKKLYLEGICTHLNCFIMQNMIPLGVAVSLANSELVLCRAALLSSSVDLPARAAINNFVQFNGYWGCCFCLQRGTLARYVVMVLVF